MQPLAKKTLKKVGLATVVGLAASCLAMLLVNTVPWLGHVELQISPNQGIAALPQIVVVSQTRDTLDKLGEVESEPDAALPRRFHADLIRTVAKGGAKVVLMDYDFSEKRNEEENQLVRDAMEQVAPTVVILGQVPHSGQQIAQGAEPTITFKGSFVKPSIEPPNVVSGSLIPYNPDLSIRGFYIRAFDPDTMQEYPHVAVLAALASRGLGSDALELSETGDAYMAPGFRWPVGLDYEYRTRWTRHAQPFPTIEYSDALRGDPARFRNKIVVVGSEVERLEYFATEAHGTMVGNQIVAQFVNSLIGPAKIQAASTSILFNALWGWTLGLIAGLFAASLRPFPVVLSLVGAGALAVLVPTYALDYANLRIETLAPAISVIVSMITMAAIYGVKAKQFDPATGRKPGRPVEAAIMFVDLKGSTAAISDMELKDASSMLRQVLESLILVIRSNGGSVERTMGDGAMAMWFQQGRRQSDHHLRSCMATVLAFREEIDKLDAATKLQFNRAADLTIGIEVGIIRGDMVIQKGHEEWSWFGTPIHLTARLQSYCGEAKQRVCIGPSLAMRIARRYPLHSLGVAEFKGFPEPVEVFTIETDQNLE